MNGRIFTFLRVKHLWCIILFLMTGWSARAQTAYTITGKVTDTKGQTMPGVSVAVKHTASGAITNVQGEYTLKLTAVPDTLVFSFIGYVKQEIAVNSRHIIDITLLEDKNNLNEVVVVAYGTQRKESLVSAITTVSPKEIKGPTSNLTTMLAGRISGLVSYQRSGEPGADNASFLSGASPLLVPVR